MPASSPAASTMPAEFSLSARVRYAFVAISTKTPAVVSRFSRVRIVNPAMIIFPPSPAASVIKGDADGGTEVTQPAALFRVTGQVHLALGRAVTNEAGRDVVFGDHDPKRRVSVDIDDGRIGLPLGPGCGEQLGLHDVRLPGIRPRL